MKLHNDTSLVIDASHQFKEQAFTIKASATAFNILSSALYTDKISAVIRELSCNAYDAHVAAEKNGVANQSQLPFDVTLPSSLSPVFKIRDYGTGLSEEDVFQLYTTYFGSTKSDSDDFIGALGLGSKSPFSIVSSFLVVSFYNQIKTVYTAIINEEGFPSIVKMHEEFTEEPNGMEISVTVSASDIHSFQTRAQTIYKYFTVRPNFLGSIKPNIETIKYDYQGNGWAIRPHNYYNREITAIQGLVAYNVPLEAVEGRLSDDAYQLLATIDSQFVFLFNIGDVEPQASREALSFTNRTIAAIERTLKTASKEIYELLRKRVECAASYVDAWTILNNFNEYEAVIASQMKFKWKGRPVTKQAIVYEEVRKATRYEVSDALLKTKSFRYKFDKKPTYCVISGDGSTTSIRTEVTHINGKDVEDSKNPDYPKERSHTLSAYVRQNVTGTIKLVLNDSKTAQFKLRRYVNKSSDYSYNDRLYVFPHNKVDQLNNMKKLLGITTHTLTSTWEIEDEERVKLKKTARIFTPKCLNYTQYGASETLEAMRRFTAVSDIEDFDTSNFKYYAVSDGNPFNIQHPFKDTRLIINTSMFNDICQMLIEAKLLKESDKIVFVSKGNVDTLKELYPNLKPLKEIFNDNKKLSSEQTVAIGNLMHYTKGSRYNEDSSELVSIQNFISIVCNNTENESLRKYLTNRLDAIRNSVDAVNYLQALNYKSFLDNNINWLKDFYGSAVKAVDIPVNKLASIRAEITKNFPIYSLMKIHLQIDYNYRYANTTLTLEENRVNLTKYVERDWKTVAILPEVINELTKGNTLELV